MVLVAFLILCTQTSVPAQMIAVLHLENAIALAELQEAHAGAVMLAIQTGTLVATIALFRWYLSVGVAHEPGFADTAEELEQ